MKPEHWQRINDVFASVLEREPAERPGFLASACHGDVELQAEVKSLLASYEESGNFLETPAFEAEWSTESEERIGPYRILREIGRGGMSTVYLAVRDDQYQKQVAVKLIKRGMDTDYVVQRFLAERQILANLVHPNIAQLLDGGMTSEGLPYFVMEYVEGVAIDEYCDSQCLSITERLKLFSTVCSAVHYAHQNLVIHRDIKPSNILVTSEGVPKLLDFGIAKLLNPELSNWTCVPTMTAMRLMTPGYASPEQVRGEPVTTASDVYLLGMLLYELLTGHRPFGLDTCSLYEVSRVVCEEELEKPSTVVSQVEETGPDGPTRLTPEAVSRTREGQPEKLRRRLSGDIDNIVLMAMRREPERRYASVEQFSADIRRHLENLPVIARKDTLGYRSTKFIRRNKAGVIAAGLITLTLVGGVVTTLQQAQIAQIERAKAERRFNDVRKLANSFMFEFHDQIKNLPGSTPARQLLISKALEYLHSLAREDSNNTSLQLEVAVAYLKVGDVQGNASFANLGDTAGALDSYSKALTICQKLSARDSTNIQIQRTLATSYFRNGNILAWNGNTTGALRSFYKGLAIHKILKITNPNDRQVRRDLLYGYNQLGEVLQSSGDNIKALENYRKYQEISRELLIENPTNPQALRDLLVNYITIGDVLTAIGNEASALESLHQAQLLAKKLLSDDSTNTQARRDLWFSYFTTGNTLAIFNHQNDALKAHTKGLILAKMLYIADLKNIQAHTDMAYSYEQIGSVMMSINNPNKALENYNQALKIRKTLLVSDLANTEIRHDLSNSHFKVGEAYAKLALDSALPTEVHLQLKYWSQARHHYQHSLELLLSLQSQGTLRSTYANQPNRVTREINNCNTHLKKLVSVV